ncbi:hypothetical protein GO685_05220 [Wolbachia endosymbiont of Madathamugadia hiepei]|nr:hypothetical protein [Wolbachia endosymbiont of Madathamugadia hiepei]
MEELFVNVALSAFYRCTILNFSVMRTAIRTLQLAGNLRNRRCHPSAPTLGWLCCMATYAVVIYDKFM